MSDKKKKKITEQEQPVETTEETAAIEETAEAAAAASEETTAEAASEETTEEAAAEETAKAGGLMAWIKSHKAASIATACAAAVLIVAVGTVAAVSLAGKNTPIPLTNSTQTTTTKKGTASQSSTTPTSEAVLVTDQSGKPVTDASGKTVTSLIGGTTKIEVVTKANGATETRIITAPTTVKTTAKAPANTPTNAPTKAPTKAPTAAPTAAPHSHSHTAVQTVAATCTSCGYTVYRCSCGDQYTGNETAALGHSYSCTDHQDAAPGREGYDCYTCGRCGDSYTETIAALPVQTATAEEVASFANSYLANLGMILHYEYNPYLDNCGYDPPFGWTRGETLEDIKQDIIDYIDFTVWGYADGGGIEGSYILAYTEQDGDNGGWLYICY